MNIKLLKTDQFWWLRQTSVFTFGCLKIETEWELVLGIDLTSKESVKWVWKKWNVNLTLLYLGHYSLWSKPCILISSVGNKIITKTEY